MEQTRRYPTSPPAEDRDAARKAEDPKAAGRRPEDDGGSPATTPAEPDARGYRNRNSGRRAAGHGGGSPDASDDGADYAVEPDGEFSGGGRGHVLQASQQREADEEMEGRTGPYIRSGLAGRDERNQDPAGTSPGSREAGDKADPDQPASPRPGQPGPASDDPDSGPPRTGGPRR